MQCRHKGISKRLSSNIILVLKYFVWLSSSGWHERWLNYAKLVRYEKNNIVSWKVLNKIVRVLTLRSTQAVVLMRICLLLFQEQLFRVQCLHTRCTHAFFGGSLSKAKRLKTRIKLCYKSLHTAQSWFDTHFYHVFNKNI